MRGESNKYQYLRSAKKGREGLCHQRTKTQAGHRALSEFAKKETLRIVPQQFLTIKRDTVQLTYPKKRLKTTKMVVLAKFLFAFCGDVPLLAVGCFNDKSVFSHFSKKITYLS